MKTQLLLRGSTVRVREVVFALVLTLLALASLALGDFVRDQFAKDSVPAQRASSDVN